MQCTSSCPLRRRNPFIPRFVCHSLNLRREFRAFRWITVTCPTLWQKQADMRDAVVETPCNVRAFYRGISGNRTYLKVVATRGKGESFESFIAPDLCHSDVSEAAHNPRSLPQRCSKPRKTLDLCCGADRDRPHNPRNLPQRKSEPCTVPETRYSSSRSRAQSPVSATVQT